MPLMARVLNAIPSKNVQSDWKFETAVAAGIISLEALPPAKDLREPWWAIGDQEQTGSCVGWAAADGVIRWHLVKAGRIGQNEHLSERYLWMAAKETDDDVSQPTSFIEEAGTSLKAALDVARKYGVVRENVLPFEPPVLYPDTPEKFYATASQLKIASYTNLGVDTGKWRQWIAFKGPVAARLVIDQAWDGIPAGGELDAYRPYPPGNPRIGGHFVAIVGYDPARFIVRNSWSTDWGDSGFAHASEAYIDAAFTESYGISV